MITKPIWTSEITRSEFGPPLYLCCFPLLEGEEFRYFDGWNSDWFSEVDFFAQFFVRVARTAWVTDVNRRFAAKVAFAHDITNLVEKNTHI